MPDIFSGDPERLARFEREAKLLASLNHPNIAAIYGLEHAEGKRFLVMELVEGETLAQRIAKEPLPVEDSLEVCRQIAEGVEAAREKGIIHRDLKPANVKITPEGKVKVLDFGLAKALADQFPAADASHSPTITEAMTRPGAVLGTAAYMSPEQAKGRPVDKRADIWAFGCILYECLTGKRAFQGDTVTETVASILKSEPDWTLLPGNTPAVVRSLLRRCLQKDAGRRLRDIADGRVEMLEEVSEPAAGISTIRRFSLAWLMSVGTAAMLIGLGIGLALMKYSKTDISTSQPVVRSFVRVEPGHWLNGVRVEMVQRPSRTAMALSSDGRFMVYSAVNKEDPNSKERPCLYLRRLDQMEAEPIPGTEGGISPFLSPDDRWIGFWAGRKLMKVPVEGGVPVPLCDVRWPFGFSCGADNQIYFAQDIRSGLSKIPDKGGNAEILTKPDSSKGEFSHRLPFVLPVISSRVFQAIFRPRRCRLDGHLKMPT